MSGGRSWTTGEVRRLHELRAQRVPAKQISIELGRSVDSIYCFLRYVPATPGRPASIKPTNRLPPKPKAPPSPILWTSGQVATLRTMIEDGATVKQISRAIDRSQRAVRAKAHDLGLRFGCRGQSLYRDQEALMFRANAIDGSEALLEALMRLAA